MGRSPGNRRGILDEQALLAPPPGEQSGKASPNPKTKGKMMKIGTAEHDDLLAAFEKALRLANVCGRLDREDKEMWPKRNFYQDGQINQMFLLYSAGYAMGRCVYLNGLS